LNTVAPWGTSPCCPCAWRAAGPWRDLVLGLGLERVGDGGGHGRAGGAPVAVLGVVLVQAVQQSSTGPTSRLSCILLETRREKVALPCPASCRRWRRRWAACGAPRWARWGATSAPPHARPGRARGPARAASGTRPTTPAAAAPCCAAPACSRSSSATAFYLSSKFMHGNGYRNTIYNQTWDHTWVEGYWSGYGLLVLYQTWDHILIAQIHQMNANFR